MLHGVSRVTDGKVGRDQRVNKAANSCPARDRGGCSSEVQTCRPGCTPDRGSAVFPLQAVKWPCAFGD